MTCKRIGQRRNRRRYREHVDERQRAVKDSSARYGRICTTSIDSDRGRTTTVNDYFPDGLPNVVASIATFVSILLSFAVYRPSSQVNLYSNGNLTPATSR